MTMLESLLIPLAVLLAVSGFGRLPRVVRESAWVWFSGGVLLGVAAVWMILGEPSIASWWDGVHFTVMVVGAGLGARTLFDLTRQTIAERRAPVSANQR